MTTLMLIECAFIGALVHRIGATERETIRQAQQREILFHTQELLNGLYAVHEALSAWFRTLDPADEQALNNRLATLQREIDFLATSYARQTSEARELESVRSMITSTDALIKTGQRKIELAPPQEKLGWMQALRLQVRDPKRRILDTVVAFLKRQTEIFARMSEKERDLERNLMPVIWAGLAANLLFAVALSRYYTTSITSRLAVMAENSGRFRRGQPLLPAMGGKDELAALDSSFRKMAHQIELDEKMRKTYVLTFRHELKVPLENLGRRLREMQDHSAQMPKQANKAISTAVRNITRLSGIIDDLTQVESAGTRIQIQVEPTNLNEVIERAADSVRALLESHSVSLCPPGKETFDENAPVVPGDSDRLVQVLVNLLSNAIKFSPRQSTVRVELEYQPEFARISVSDSGRGIPADKLGSLFERFKQVDASDGRRGTGTGLGLSICKEIVELHGGRIGVKSEEGKGSTFWLELPRSRPHSEPEPGEHQA